jgi:hypothetical protein
MRYNKELIINATANSDSLADVLRFFNLKITGGNYVHMHWLIKKFEIDTSHFTGQLRNKTKIPFNKHTKESFIKSHLVIWDKLKPVNTDRIKKRLIEFGLKNRICERCEETKWMGSDIPLEIHHNNGNRWDNRIDNIKLLCPNCHAITDNYCSKKRN